MKCAAAVLATLTTALAEPAPATKAVSMTTTNVPQWIIEGLKRACNPGDTKCTWTFKVDTHLSPTTCCIFDVYGSPASQTDASGVTCGPYTVGTGWSGQFGPGNGFTTLSVINYADKTIVWPAYTDKQLKNGVTVSPDQCYAPTVLSW